MGLFFNRDDRTPEEKERDRKTYWRDRLDDAVVCPWCGEPSNGPIPAIDVGPWPTGEGYAIIGQGDCVYCGQPNWITSTGDLIRYGEDWVVG